MAHSNPPEFGNWESDNVPYTLYFEKARKNRGDKMRNPNDPEENHDMLSSLDPSPLVPAPAPSASPNPRPEDRRTPKHRMSKENGDFRPYSNSPSRDENKAQKGSNKLNTGGHGQRTTGLSARPSGGSEQSFDRSPLNPHYQAKVTGRGSGSPSWDGKNHDISHGTPSRSRLSRPAARGDESPDKAAAVPKFGDWDDNNPQSADNFTHIFNQVREGRNPGAGRVSGTPRHSSSHGARSQQANKPKKCCCFPWW